MSFSFSPLSIEGCFEILPTVSKDIRGEFIKTFHVEMFQEQGLYLNFAEEFYSVSKYGVLRGMHFQVPPYEHTKLVYCTEGSVLDVLLDLRKKSKTYRKSLSLELSYEKKNMIYIPTGVAHGFCTLSHSSTMIYKTSKVYNPQADVGILWSSFDFTWPIEKPILSERDQAHQLLSQFVSPF